MGKQISNNITDKSNIEILMNSMVFRGFSQEEILDIVEKLGGKIRAVAKDEIVFHEQEQVDQIGILLSGELCKVQSDLDGGEQLMQKIGKSYMVGLEIAVTSKQLSPYYVYASKPSQIYFFPEKSIRGGSVLDDATRLHIYQNLILFLAGDNIRQYKKIEILSSRGARERIEKYLHKQSSRHGTPDFYIELNREQMANYLGLNRSVLSHELKKMEHEGILKVRKNHFVLLDIEEQGE